MPSGDTHALGLVTEPEPIGDPVRDAPNDLDGRLVIAAETRSRYEFGRRESDELLDGCLKLVGDAYRLADVQGKVPVELHG